MWRLRARLAAACPGRHGAPPPATTSRREELADGEIALARPHEKRGPGREIATMERRKASAGAFLRRGRMMLRRAALHPPRPFGRGRVERTSRSKLRRG